MDTPQLFRPPDSSPPTAPFLVLSPTAAPSRTPGGTLTVDIPGFQIETEIGRGGMGVVYRAQHVQLKRTVALKVVLAGQFATPEQRLRFQFEAELAARIRHRNVVQVYEAGRCGDMPYLVTEYLPGGTLAGLLQGKPQPPRQAARWLAELADGVAAAHRHGVLHRDLKPTNVLVDADGTLKVTDFGLAKRLGDATRMTTTGVVVGTPAYMAPEHTEPGQEPTAAADIYSLGVILFEMLTGRPPYNPNDPIEALLHARTMPAPSPRTYQPRVPRDLETICLKCLEKSPDRRYASADALLSDLRCFLERRPIAARPVTFLERLVRWCWRNPVIAGLSAALGLALTGGLGIALWLYRDAEERRHAAEAAHRAAEVARAAAEEQRQRAEAAEAEAIDNLRATQMAAEGVLNQFLDHQRLNLMDFTGLRQEMLAAMVPMFEELAKRQGASPHAEAARAWAYHRLGSLLLELRQIAPAKNWLQQTIAVLGPLYQQHPDDLELGLELARALTNLGRAMTFSDTAHEAPAITAEANRILQRLVDAHPKHQGARLALGQNEVNLSQFDLGLAKTAAGEEHLRRALEHATWLLGHESDREEYLYFASVVHTNLGTLLKRQRRFSESKSHLQSALTMREALVRRVPGSLEYRSAHAKACRSMGDFFAERGRTSEALPYFEEALRRQAAVLEAGGDLPAFREDLAKMHDATGIALRRLQRLAECEAHFRKAIALRERLVTERPGIREYAVRLGGSYCNLGNHDRDRRIAELGVPWYDKAIGMLRPLAEQVTSKDDAHAFLTNSYVGRAKAFSHQGRFRDAAADYRAAAEWTTPDRREGLLVDAATSLILSQAHQESLTLLREVADTATQSDVLFFAARKCAAAAGSVEIESPIRRSYHELALTLLRKSLARDATAFRRGWWHDDLQSLRANHEFIGWCWELAEAPALDWLAW
jgi:serine/threonine-protein kinase